MKTQCSLLAVFLASAAGLASADSPNFNVPIGTVNYAATPPVLNFYGAIGVSTPTQSIIITAAAGNTGVLTFTTCTFSGPNAADYSLSPSPTFPLQVAAGASVGIPIRFFAGALGPRNANISCQTSNGTAVGGSFPISLNGMGVTRTLITPTSLLFPETMQGSSSAPLNVTATAGATNTGNVTIASCSLGGAHPDDFAQIPPVTNVAVAPGATILFPVTFSPTDVGARAATLTCNLVNGPTANFAVALTGSGAAPSQTTTRVSVASGGAEGDGDSFTGSLSAEGRHVVFTSSASNLVPDDTNGWDDIFVHDRSTNQTQRVSVATGGMEVSGLSSGGVISADGRYVAFISPASTLVPGDTNNLADVFVHDRQTGQTQRASVASGGVQATGPSFCASLSADGRHVAFTSSASNLVPNDTNFANDVFVHDRQTNQTQRVNVRSSGGEALGSSFGCAISADGLHVSFSSDAFNLVNDDTNGAEDVFVHSRQTGQTQRVSVNNGGGQANATSAEPSIAADGRLVAFTSLASNLVSNDNNGMVDVFVHDRWTGQTRQASLAAPGWQANGQSYKPSLSADGRYVAFVSEASNLVPDDTNAAADVFVLDRQLGQTQRVSVTTGDWQAGQQSWAPSISADGRHVAFTTNSSLVAADTNDSIDVYVRDRGDDAINLLFRNGFE